MPTDVNKGLTDYLKEGSIKDITWWARRCTTASTPCTAIHLKSRAKSKPARHAADVGSAACADL